MESTVKKTRRKLTPEQKEALRKARAEIVGVPPKTLKPQTLLSREFFGVLDAIMQANPLTKSPDLKEGLTPMQLACMLESDERNNKFIRDDDSRPPKIQFHRLVSSALMSGLRRGLYLQAGKSSIPGARRDMIWKLKRS